jgi:hypothetical protein
MVITNEYQLLFRSGIVITKGAISYFMITPGPILLDHSVCEPRYAIRFFLENDKDIETFRYIGSPS